MNLLNKKWIKYGKVNLRYQDNKIVIDNQNDKHRFIILPTVNKKNNKYILNLI